MSRALVADTERKHNRDAAAGYFGSLDIHRIGFPFVLGVDSFPSCISRAVDVDICAGEWVGIVAVKDGSDVYAELIIAVCVNRLAVGSILV